MALQEYYNTGDDVPATITGTNWYAMTWTTTSAYTISSVKLKLYRSATPPANFTVSIRETTTGKPSGGDLTSGSITGSTITEGTPGDFIEISLTPYALSNATKYAIVCRVDTISAYWRADNSSPTYTDGNGCSSVDSGTNWTTGTYDFMFEVYTGTFSELSGTIAGVSAVSGNLGSTVVGMDVPTSFVKRLVVAGNNNIYYESI